MKQYNVMFYGVIYTPTQEEGLLRGFSVIANNPQEAVEFAFSELSEYLQGKVNTSLTTVEEGDTSYWGDMLPQEGKAHSVGRYLEFND
jgi:hypothetical protein